ncbi:MAG: DRTGG domain-containing protein [Bacteroidota bacterium]
MKSAVFASIREGSGKTSVIVGIMAALKQNYGYVKPIGDRLIYKRKRNRDYDSHLVTDLFQLSEEAESITLGFDHSKLRYMYDDETIQKAVAELVDKAGKDRDGVLIEAGKDIFYGSSLRLDPLSLAQHTGSNLVFIVSGDSESVIDDLAFARRNMNMEGIPKCSVIVNKVHDIEEFEDLHLRQLQDMGYEILGLLPYKERLTRFTVSYLAQRFYAKIVAGEDGLSNTVKNVFVGAMSTDEILRNPLFNKENKFLITSGDRTDMILAALEGDTSGILMTNNILPPSNIISRANEKNIPLLLVSMDTFNASAKFGHLETLLTKDNEEMIRMLTQLAEKYIKLDHIFG